MSYNQAAKLFRENLQLLGQPQKDPLMWNLCTGLAQLAEAIREDMAATQKKLAAIDSDVKSLR